MRETSNIRPRFKFGYCENCAPKSASPEPCWTEKTHYGIYLCPDCIEKGSPEKHPVFIDPALRRISYKTVLLSALIGTSLYPRGLVRQIAASIISYPVNDVKCRNDAALLSYIARKYELDRSYIDMADKLLFEKSYTDDLVEFRIGDDISYLARTEASTYAVMYMTYELHALPKSRHRIRKDSGLFNQTEDVK